MTAAAIDRRADRAHQLVVVYEHNSTRGMCETSTGCRSAGVHAVCGAAHGDAFTASCYRVLMNGTPSPQCAKS
eukprot:1229484-Prymnesium_polylepis.1